MSEEIWKAIVGYDGLYEISSYGRIKSLDKSWPIQGTNRRASKKGKMLKPDSNDGYLHIKLWKDSQFKWFQMHQLVAITFIPNPLKKPKINHINHQRHDNMVNNLEWCTQKENMEHASKTGRLEHINAKSVICTKSGKIYLSCKKAAEASGVNYQTLRSYLNGALPNKTTLKYSE